MGIDLIGPFNVAAQGNRFILTCTCLWSKFPVAYAIPDKSAASVASKLVKMFWQHGPPQRIITDNGREFVDHCSDSLFEKFGVRQAVTLAHHPQTNGQDERTNQTLKRRLSKLVNEQQDNWDEDLDAILFGIRSSISQATKFTPFFLMFCREARQISDIVFADTECAATMPQSATEKQVQERMEFCQLIGQRVKVNIERAQAKMKKTYEARVSKGTGVLHLKWVILSLSRTKEKLEEKVENWNQIGKDPTPSQK